MRANNEESILSISVVLILVPSRRSSGRRVRQRPAGRLAAGTDARPRRARRGRRRSGARRGTPGEAAAVEWLVAGPSAPATLDWAFALCTTGGADCADAPPPIAAGSGAPVVVPFTTPDAAALGTDLLPLMLGVVCADGTVGIDPNAPLPTCTGPGASGTPVRFTIPVAPDGATPNRHPVFSQRRHRAGGRGVGSGDRDGGDGRRLRRDDRLPVVTATAAGVEAVKQHIRIVSDGDDRETFTPEGAAAAQLEEIQISNFTTAGKFESSYAAIFATDTRPDADVTVKWEPPKAATVGAAGQVVTFHFVVRDLRGGLDWTSRALCAVAP